MDFTIQQLAKTAKISVRTLRYYDQIGLLVPKVRMANGRRYYGVEDLLALVHILIFKDLGFGLDKIQSILQESPRYKTCALKAQKTILAREGERINKCLKLIDMMINQEKKMINQDNAQTYLDALTKHRQEHVQLFDEAYYQEKIVPIHEQFHRAVGDAYFNAWRTKLSQPTSQMDAAMYGMQSGYLFNEVRAAQEKGAGVDSLEMQQIIAKQWETLQLVYPPTHSKTIYLAIRDQVCGKYMPLPDPTGEVRRMFDYISEAMTVFAETHFSEA